MAESVPPARIRLFVAAASAADGDALAFALDGAGHEVVSGYPAEIAIGGAKGEQPEVVVLDPTGSEDDVVDVVASAHAVTDAPIIVITDLRDEAVVVAALEAGATDVVGRPARMLELLARIDAAARRRSMPMGVGQPSRDGLAMDVGRREATVDGRTLALTSTEFELLYVIAAHQGSVVDYRSIRRGGPMGRREVDLKTLRSHVSRINAKLVAEGHPGVRNVRRRGYALRLRGSIHQADEPADASVATH